MGMRLSSILGNPLAKLSVEIADMGGMVEKQLADAILCFDERDTDLAKKIIERDAEIDQREHRIEEVVTEALQNRRVSPEQMTEALAAVRNANDLERIGDLAKNVAKRSLVLSECKQTAAHSSVVRMSKIALRQVSEVLDAMARNDYQAATAIWAGDQEIDEIYNSVFREILLVMSKDPADVNALTHLVFVAKNFERVGDHATNLAERVYYTATGKRLEGERSSGDETHLSSPPPEES